MNSVQDSVQRFTATALAGVFIACAGQVAALPVGDGIVLDAPSATVYIMSPKGVEARSLADGSLRWRNVDAQRPLAAVGDLLLAQGASRASGSLPLMSLAGNTGAARQAFSATLPGNVRASVDQRLGERFAVSMENDALIWRYEARTVQGIPPQGNDPRRASLAGVLTVDTAAGAAAVLDRPVPADSVVNAQLDTPLVNDAGRQFYSADRQHVLVSARLTAGDVERRYRWTVYDLQRKKLGSFDAPVSYSPFAVSGGRVLLIAPPTVVRRDDAEQDIALSVRAMSLASGKEMWRAPLRDTRYRGPFPP